MVRARLDLMEFRKGDVMKFPFRSLPAGQPGKLKGRLAQIGTVAGFVSLSYEALHIIAPVSLVLLQLFLDVCQACVTFLRIRGV